jgi:hypothetical protein
MTDLSDHDAPIPVITMDRRAHPTLVSPLGSPLPRRPLRYPGARLGGTPFATHCTQLAGPVRPGGAPFSRYAEERIVVVGTPSRIHGRTPWSRLRTDHDET